MPHLTWQIKIIKLFDKKRIIYYLLIITYDSFKRTIFKSVRLLFDRIILSCQTLCVGMRSKVVPRT
jgi:hypothetical protein